MVTPPAVLCIRKPVLKWIRAEAATLQVPEVSGAIREMEFDEMWHFIGSKKTKNGSSKRWIVLQGEPGRLGARRSCLEAPTSGDTATFSRLYDKVKHLTDCRFYTDDWDAFASVLPKDRHVIGKQHTVAIERDNSNTRHPLGRMTRRVVNQGFSPHLFHIARRCWMLRSSFGST